MIETTLNKIKGSRLSVSAWNKLLTSLGKTEADDEPLPLMTILESNGLEDALRCCRTLPEQDQKWRLFAVWCARRVEYLMIDVYSVAALDVAERYANGQATQEELESARAEAKAAADAIAWATARAAWTLATDATASVALAATWAAANAALAATWTVTESASEAVVGARDASEIAAKAAAKAAVDAAVAAAAKAEAKAAQEQEFKRVVG